ncbi:MAG: glucosaminidase domain-containing protein [Bacteroidota bacterium]|nr:glucosaminidase domain-containing protein [Bacteroidota bacterium]
MLLLILFSSLTYLYTTGKFYEDDSRIRAAQKALNDSIKKLIAAPVVLDSAFLHTPSFDASDEKIRESVGLSIQIMGHGTLSSRQMITFLLSQNHQIDSLSAKEFVDEYVSAAAKEGVNHDMAFCQMCLETGFLKFDGMVPPDLNNFAGIGAFEGSREIERYPSMHEGVIAHIQHLKAYASVAPPSLPLVDKHFYNIKRGSAPTLNQLAERWAEDKLYSLKIMILIAQCRRFSQ